MAHGTDGELITYDATGAPANVAVGTSGQVLTSGGAGVAPTFQAAAGVSTLAALTDSTISASDPTISTNPSATGHIWVNKTSGESYVCTDATTGANIWTNIGDGTGAVEPTYYFYGGRGVFAGGSGNNTIDYINISSTGNATDFGDCTFSRSGVSGLSNASRGVFGGGLDGSYQSSLDYVTIASTGNGTNFGNLTVARDRSGTASGNHRGVWAGGWAACGSCETDNMDYITITSTGNATNFGTLTAGMYSHSGCSNETRGVFGAAYNSNTLHYITIATTGNSTDFGDLAEAFGYNGATSNTTRGLFFGGGSIDGINYITIASTGNGTDFGNFSTSTGGFQVDGVCNGTRAVFAGRSSHTNTMDYVTVASTGNATDFGDMSVSRVGYGAFSGD